MDTDNPIDKNSSNVLVDVTLAAHVEAVGLCVLLSRLHVLLNIPAVQTDVVDVTESSLINFTDFRGHIMLNSLLICSQLGMEANLWQLVTAAQTGRGSSKRAAHRRCLILVLLEVKRV